MATPGILTPRSGQMRSRMPFSKLPLPRAIQQVSQTSRRDRPFTPHLTHFQEPMDNLGLRHGSSARFHEDQHTGSMT